MTLDTPPPSANLPAGMTLDTTPGTAPMSSDRDIIKNSVADALGGATKNIQDTAMDINKTFNDPNISIGDKALKGLSGAGHVAGAVASVIPASIGGVVSHLIPDSVKSTTGDVANWIGDQINKIPGATDKLNWMNRVMDENPDLPKSVSDVLNTTSLLGGEKATPESKVTPKENISMTEPPVPKTIPELTKVISKKEQSNIQAINTELSGAKLAKAYKGVVTGTRDVTPSSLFREQGLSPEQQTVNLGKRLASEIKLSDGTVADPIHLTGDHVKNLTLLKKSLTDTETKLTTELKGDLEINYNADKPTLQEKLSTTNSKMPREFKQIKDSKSVFNGVINFAKETIESSDDSITGIRDARTEFDTQAKTEYPSAYRDGAIDTKSPAGRAIKIVRDTINEHLYNTAPNGSDIQKLIGREADIFRATDGVAENAAKGHGKTDVIKFKDRHPTASKVLKTGAVVAGTAVGIPLIKHL